MKKWPVRRSASHNSQALSPRLGPMLGRPNRCFPCSRHGVVRRCIVVGCVTAAACQRGTNIQRLEEEMPPKDPLSFMQPRTSTACFIFKAYPVTKDTSVLHLDYMWTSVSSCMGGGGVNVSLSCPQASLCPTCFLMAWGADKSHLSACCRDTRWCGC